MNISNSELNQIRTLIANNNNDRNHTSVNYNNKSKEEEVGGKEEVKEKLLRVNRNGLTYDILKEFVTIDFKNIFFQFLQHFLLRLSLGVTAGLCSQRKEGCKRNVTTTFLIKTKK